MIIAIIITAIVSIAIMLFLYSMLLKNVDRGYTDVIKMAYDQLNIAAKKQNTSVCKYVEKNSGKDYAIVFAGRLFMVLNKNTGEKKGQPLKYQEIVNDLNDYLQVELKDDITEYKKNQKTTAEMLKKDIEDLKKNGE